MKSKKRSRAAKLGWRRRRRNPIHQELDRTIHQAMAVGLKFKRLGYNKRRRGGNSTRPTPYKWFVRMYGVKDGARFYRAHRAKKHHWRRR